MLGGSSPRDEGFNAVLRCSALMARTGLNPAAEVLLFGEKTRVELQRLEPARLACVAGVGRCDLSYNANDAMSRR